MVQTTQDGRQSVQRAPDATSPELEGFLSGTRRDLQRLDAALAHSTERSEKQIDKIRDIIQDLAERVARMEGMLEVYREFAWKRPS